jgi:DNA-3-methyladenine glycosylase II
MEPTATFELKPRGPFSLEASIGFLEGFAPLAHVGVADGPKHIHLAFVADGTEDVAGVCFRQKGRTVAGEVFGQGDLAIVRAQAERILSLDVDGSGWPEVGVRDPVIGRLQQRSPGLRPVLFSSPYEAAAWTIIGHRVRMEQASRIKARMAEGLGPSVEVDGQRLGVFPQPSALRRLDRFPGLIQRKVENLRSLGEAALIGRLDAEHLRSMGPEDALRELQRLPGIGPFSSELILLRGAGQPDWLALHSPAFRRAVARAYGLAEEPTDEQLHAIAEPWRPYRTWATLLLRVMLEEEGENGDRVGPGPDEAE